MLCEFVLNTQVVSPQLPACDVERYVDSDDRSAKTKERQSKTTLCHTFL